MSKFKFSNFILVVMHQPHIKTRMHSFAFFCSDATMRGSRISKLEHCQKPSFHLSTTSTQSNSNFITSNTVRIELCLSVSEFA